MSDDFLSTPVSRDELAVVYSALILADDDIPITADKIDTILRAAEVKVEPIWPSLFARALQGINIRDLITNIGASLAGGGGGGGGGGEVAMAAGATPGAAAGGQKEEEKKDAPAEESDEDSDDMGLSLFD